MDMPDEWRPDPYGLHEHRYFIQGHATAHVSDRGRVAYDEPPLPIDPTTPVMEPALWPPGPPAGWYPHPSAAGRRFWDGQRWTAHTRGASSPHQVPLIEPGAMNPFKRHRAEFATVALTAVGLAIALAAMGSPPSSNPIQLSEISAPTSTAPAATTTSPPPTSTIGTSPTSTASAPVVVPTTVPPTSTTTPDTSPTTTVPPQTTTLASTPSPSPPVTTFGDGTYLVGSQVVGGTYRTSGGTGCYWARLSSSLSGSGNEIIAKNTATGPVIVTISLSDAAFVSDGCGTWSPAPSTGPQASAMGNGTWAVGVDIVAGTYEATSKGSCYWARLSSFGGAVSDILSDGDPPSGPVIVTISGTDVGFLSSQCGTWTRVG